MRKKWVEECLYGLTRSEMFVITGTKQTFVCSLTVLETLAENVQL